jgi:hypothetical protein
MVQRTEAQIAAIIAMCNGDLRGALRAMMLDNKHLETQLEQLVAATDPQTEYWLH